MAQSANSYLSVQKTVFSILLFISLKSFCQDQLSIIKSSDMPFFERVSIIESKQIVINDSISIQYLKLSDNLVSYYEMLYSFNKNAILDSLLLLKECDIEEGSVGEFVGGSIEGDTFKRRIKTYKNGAKIKEILQLYLITKEGEFKKMN